MEERVHLTLAYLLFSCEDILDPRIDKQYYELCTQSPPTVPVACAIFSHFSMEAYSDSVHIDGHASSYPGKFVYH